MSHGYFCGLFLSHPSSGASSVVKETIMNLVFLPDYISPSFSSATGHDECIVLFGDSQGCINIIVIASAGECLR